MIESSLREEALEPVIESFLARFRAGDRPGVEEYAARHPGLADVLRQILPALVAVERDLTVERGPEAQLVPPTTASSYLGDYRILREIGRGGMGVVYEAVQQSLGRHVALKVLPGSRAEAGLERFRLEARAAARLHHTNIVPVFGVGEDAGVYYFAMQHIRGQGLDQVVEELRRLRSAGAAPMAVEPTVAARLLGGTFEPAASAAASTVAPRPRSRRTRRSPTQIRERSRRRCRARRRSWPTRRARDVPIESTSTAWRGSRSRSPTRSPTPMARASCTATSSRRTSCSTPGARPG